MTLKDSTERYSFRRVAGLRPSAIIRRRVGLSGPSRSRPTFDDSYKTRLLLVKKVVLDYKIHRFIFFTPSVSYNIRNGCKRDEDD